MGTLPTIPIEKMQRAALAPDGLPWPPGYFDRTPRISFEDALVSFGVRPNHYRLGWPVYTQLERDNPAYINTIPEESPEVEEYWRNDWVEWKKLHPDAPQDESQ